MIALTPAQEQAIRHPAARLRVLACAGSGKTEVLARRVVRLLLDGVEPAALIAFTFTDKAARELRSRIELRAAGADESYRLLPPGGRGMFVGTTHSWALQSLQSLGGAYETLDPLTDAAEWALLYRVARRLGLVDLLATLGTGAPARVNTPAAIDVFLRSAEVVHNEGVDRASLTLRAPEFAHTLRRYEGLLAGMHLMPFRLMIASAVEELRPGGRLHAGSAGRVKHVFVDEFQDFNPTQDRLLSLLVAAGADVTVVADDDQAIYQWRGGDVSLFTDFPTRYAGTVDAPLEENHRSTPHIVTFAGHLAETLRGRLPKTLAAARDGGVTASIEVVVLPTAQDEADMIAGRVERLRAEGHALEDIAVLYRSVRTSAAPLVDALRARDIRFSVVGKTSLLARPEMALIARVFVYWAGGTWFPSGTYESETVTGPMLEGEIAALTKADAPSATAIVNKIDRLGELIRADGVDDSVDLLNELLVVLGLPRADGPTREERGLGQMSALVVEFDRAVRRAAPAEFYAAQAPAADAETAEDLALIPREVAAVASGRTVVGRTRGETYLARMRVFLEQYAGRAAEETPDTAPGEGEGVQIMTVHQAKGLEFPIVFVPALIEERFPSRMTGQPRPWYVPDDLFDRARYEGREDDEARLLYVALTRAQDLLVLSWFEHHRVAPARRSHFIDARLAAGLPLAATLSSGHPPVAQRARDSLLLETDFSSLATYAQCGYRYWLRHVCGFEPPLVPELGFGRLLHHVVAELARRAAVGEGVDREAAADILDDSFYLPFAGPIPAANLKASIRRRVGRYLETDGAELQRTIQPEARFEVPLENARVRGRIDLLLRALAGGSKAVELVDFKTSENKPPDQLHQDQLRLYAIAAERMGLEPVRLAIHDLDVDGGGRVEVNQDERAASAFRDQLATWVEGIGAGRYDPPVDPHTCYGCDYRRFCRHAPDGARRFGGPSKWAV